MEIKIQEYNDTAVIAIKGRLDHATVPQLDQVFTSVIDRGTYKLIIDFNQLDFLSSAGIDALLIVQKNLRGLKRGEVLLVGLQSRVRDVLALAGLSGFFNHFDDVSSAMKFAASLPGTPTTDTPQPGKKDGPKSQ